MLLDCRGDVYPSMDRLLWLSAPRPPTPFDSLDSNICSFAECLQLPSLTQVLEEIQTIIDQIKVAHSPAREKQNSLQIITLKCDKCCNRGMSSVLWELEAGEE